MDVKLYYVYRCNHWLVAAFFLSSMKSFRFFACSLQYSWLANLSTIKVLHLRHWPCLRAMVVLLRFSFLVILLFTISFSFSFSITFSFSFSLDSSPFCSWWRRLFNGKVNERNTILPYCIHLVLSISWNVKINELRGFFCSL